MAETAYKYMKDPNGVKIQVDSAIRDGNGAKIDTHYATKTELQDKQDIYKNKGSATQGVYTDANGQIQPMTYSLGMSVPAGSKLTDTTYTAGDGLVLTGTVFTPNTSFVSSGKNYKVSVDSTTKGLFVNVPWTDTVTTANTSGTGNAVTSITASNGQLTIKKDTTFLTAHQTVTDNAPTLDWDTTSTVATIGNTPITVKMPPNPDTNTTYSQASGGGLILSGTQFSVNTGYTTSGKNYKVQVDQSTGGLYVNVPWSGSTYSAGDGLVLTGTVFTPNTSYVTSGKNYKVSVDSTTKGLYVNVPWENTITTIASTTGSGNAVTQISASNGQLTVTKGTTFATASQLQGKQDSLSSTQLNAVNSGITSSKVSQYDGYASGKQDTLVSGTNIKTVSGQSLLGSGDISISASPQIATITVPAQGGTVTVTGMTVDAVVWVAPAPTSQEDYVMSGCKCTAQQANSLTFTVDKQASASMNVNVAWM